MADWTNIGNNDQKKDSNKRRSVRRKYSTGVTYKVLAAPKGTGLIQDISEIGAGLMIDQYLPAGTILQLTFILKRELEEIPIEATAKVAWCSGEEGAYRVGVQFIE